MDSMGGAGYAAPAQRPFNPLEAVIGVIIRPVDAMRQIAAARPWPFAIALAIIIGLISGLASLAARNTTVADLTAAGGIDPATAETMEGLLNFYQSPALPVLSALLWPLVLAIGAGIFYLCGRLLGGRGPFSALYSTYSFAWVPYLLLAPFTAIFNLLGGVVAALGSCLSFFFLIWTLVLIVFGIRESLNLSTGRAIGALLIPLAVIFALSCGLILLLIAAAAGTSA